MNKQVLWTDLGKSPAEAMHVINNLKPGRPVTDEERKRGIVAHFKYPDGFVPKPKKLQG